MGVRERLRREVRGVTADVTLWRNTHVGVDVGEEPAGRVGGAAHLGQHVCGGAEGLAYACRGASASAFAGDGVGATLTLALAQAQALGLVV